MPSTEHEILVELFRNRGELAAELIRIREGTAFDHARIEPGSIDLSQVTSTEYRADSVILLQDPGGQDIGAVVVEVQLGSMPTNAIPGQCTSQSCGRSDAVRRGCW